MKNIGKKITIILTSLFILSIGAIGGYYLTNISQPVVADNLSLDEQEATVRAIKKVMPAVVSIAVFEDIEVVVQMDNEESRIIRKKKEGGQGTGFLISSNGYILTNKHVIQLGDPEKAEYAITLSNGEKYYAQYIGVDPLKDLAVLKIFDSNLPNIELGNSNELEPGMSVIAIGNAFGRYQNSVTKGIVSGLGRDISATNFSGKQVIFNNVIQTDADINQGNSGGPLIDLAGKVIGINSVIDQSGTSVGFAIPINDARAVINSIRESDRIIRPRLGVWYQMVTPEIAIENNLSRDNGAWISSGGDSTTPILEDSPADKGGLQPDDIIFEVNAIKLDVKNNLFSVLQSYKVGDRIGFKVQRGEKILILIITLDEF